jgi:hypothetical protein
VKCGRHAIILSCVAVLMVGLSADVASTRVARIQYSPLRIIRRAARVVVAWVRIAHATTVELSLALVA